MRRHTSHLVKRLWNWFSPQTPAHVTTTEGSAKTQLRGSVDHVIILDGTLSNLGRGTQGNCGLLFQLLNENGLVANRTVHYQSGVQWQGWRGISDIAQGRGIDAQIIGAYSWLASHYVAGDRIFLFGYSRGAFAVRSLAGVIDRVGLLHREHATESAVKMIYRHYRMNPNSTAAVTFAKQFCHDHVPIEMVGVWDTVKALGIRLPLLWMLSEKEYAFHDHRLGASIRHGFHALAIHETRAVFEPVMWECPDGGENRVKQVWFRGAHPDIGGQIGRFGASRPLANISLVWMLEQAETVGLGLPVGWKNRFVCDPTAPMVGTLTGVGLIFLLRRRRKICVGPSESLHPSAIGQKPFYKLPWPLTLLF
jgi:uncharacterized protein (DUF2235 family)